MKVLKIRVTDKMRKQIEALAEQSNLSLSGYVRELIKVLINDKGYSFTGNAKDLKYASKGRNNTISIKLSKEDKAALEAVAYADCRDIPSLMVMVFTRIIAGQELISPDV